jgi:triosephosphate isomerase
MNKTTREAIDYMCRLLDRLSSISGLEKVQLFVIPPFTSLEAVKQRSSGKFWVGAQNMHSELAGAFTGEVSAPMLRDLGVDLVELGHAERRQYFNENDVAIHYKIQRALEFGLRALLCVGESAQEKDFGVERESVARQIKIALKGVSAEQSSSIIVAYEPAWAIGDLGTAADAEYLRAMSGHIREVLQSLFDCGSAERVPVIYGGGVNGSNAAEILTRGRMDGLFIGRAAWEPEGFASLVRICLESMPMSSEAAQHAAPEPEEWTEPRHTRRGNPCD